MLQVEIQAGRGGGSCRNMLGHSGWGGDRRRVRPSKPKPGSDGSCKLGKELGVYFTEEW